MRVALCRSMCHCGLLLLAVTRRPLAVCLRFSYSFRVYLCGHAAAHAPAAPPRGSLANCAQLAS